MSQRAKELNKHLTNDAIQKADKHVKDIPHYMSLGNCTLKQ